MARRMLFPAGFTVLIVVLILAHEACSANDSHHRCPPSSCGNTHNIVYPFRLKDDPPICGDQRYNLSCENNQTVLYLYAGKYYVQEINYSAYTIRVVDPGIQKDNINFMPLYFLNHNNFSSGDPFSLSYPDNIKVRFCNGDQYEPIQNRFYDGTMSETGVVWVKCEKPMISELYFDTSTCFGNGLNSSNSSLFHSKSYRYVHVLYSQSLKGLGDSCQIEQMFPTVFYPSTCTEVYDQVAYGFKLSWVQVLCDNFKGDDFCYLDNVNFPVQCYPPSPTHDSSNKLSQIFRKFIEVLSNILLPRIIKEKLWRIYPEEEASIDPLIKLLIIMITYGGLYFSTKVLWTPV